MADFLDAGLQLEAALQIMESQDETSPKSRVAALIREKVREGTAFSEAIRTSSPSFGDLYCSVIAAGEISGALTILLRRQAEHMQAIEELKQRIKMALIYPSFLLGTASIAIIVFITFLIPEIAILLNKVGGVMPLPALILLKVGEFFQSYGLWMAMILVGCFVLFYLQIRNPNGKHWWDKFKLSIPLWGPLLNQAFQAQFCQTLSNLLNNGVPLHHGLTLVSTSVGNSHHRQLINQIITHLGEGQSLSMAMKNAGGFPSTMRDMIRVGEQTGDLGPCLGKLGQRYDKSIKHQIEGIMAFIQPVIIVVMGVMVLLIAWSMISGIFQAMHGLQR